MFAKAKYIQARQDNGYNALIFRFNTVNLSNLQYSEDMYGSDGTLDSQLPR